MPAASLTAQYLYVAVTPVGGRKVGLRPAASQAALHEALRREHLLLLRTWRLPEWASTAGEISLKDQAGMNEQLSILLSRGVPLTEAIEVAASVVSGQASAKLTRMRELVSGGASFAGACEEVGGFDPVAVAVYRSAERTGDLAGAALRLGAAAKRRIAIGQKAVTLLIYPCVVLAISILASLVMLAVVIPQVGNALTEANVPLPGYTKVMMAMGTFVRDNALWVGVGIAALIVLAIIARATILGAVLGVFRRLPAVGRLQTAIEAARFFAVMGAMTRSGVPVADALGVASGAVTEPGLRAQFETMRRKLVEGGLLRQLLEQVDELPLATRRLLIAAERSGELDAAFDTVSTDLANEVDKRSERLLALLEPLLIVLMFALIGAMLLSIMIPLITLSNRVGEAGGA